MLASIIRRREKILMAYRKKREYEINHEVDKSKMLETDKYYQDKLRALDEEVQGGEVAGSQPEDKESRGSSQKPRDGPRTQQDEPGIQRSPVKKHRRNRKKRQEQEGTPGMTV